MTKIPEFAVRTRVAKTVLEEMRGKLLTERDRNLTLNPAGGPCRVFKPGGMKLLCVYLPGVLREEMDAAYPTLTKIRGVTDNRGLASGSQRVDRRTGSSRTRAKEIMSSIVGAFEANGPFAYCRLTAYNAQQAEEFENLVPLLQRIGQLFEEYVPDRYSNQVAECRKTQPEWVIRGTPFTTVTINNTYPTGVHTDAGDLDAGFSTLATARKGCFTGGVLTFPEYRLGVDMQHGDLLLMDAHDWHGNTPLVCNLCGESLDRPNHDCDIGAIGDPEYLRSEVERISVVSYFRTNMVKCGSTAEEEQRRQEAAENRTRWAKEPLERSAVT